MLAFADSMLLSRLSRTALRRHPALLVRHCSSAAATAQPTVKVEVDVPPPVEEEPTKDSVDEGMRPREIMAQLDKYIVGQSDAKKAVAVAAKPVAVAARPAVAVAAHGDHTAIAGG